MTHHEQPYTVGLWTVKTGMEKEFLKRWQRFAEWSIEGQQGAIEATMVNDLDNPQRFVSFGQWQSVKHIEAWRDNPERERRLAGLEELCEETQLLTCKKVANIRSRARV